MENPEGFFKCDSCDYKSKWKANVIRHMVTKHSSSNTVVPFPSTVVLCPSKVVPRPSKVVSLPNTVDTCKSIINPKECDLCHKIFTQRWSMLKHRVKCNGLTNKLQCCYCLTIFKHSSNLCYHKKICKAKKEASVAQELCTEYVYLIKERESIQLNENIYKIGRTNQCHLKRLAQYPKGSVLLLHLTCKNSTKVENDIKILFNKKYTQKREYGLEYFEGDYRSMINDIHYLASNSLC